MEKKTILTGLQPTGDITLGNYLGSIKPMVDMQDSIDNSYIFIADMHAITMEHDENALRDKIKSLVGIYLASGIDPEKNTIFLQSDNLYHANLSWLLECTAYFGELSRMIQFKEKSLKNKNIKAGLLTYPVLMAADILLYDVSEIPVGADQKQHVELTRDIAERFNNRYKEVFKIPKAVISEDGSRKIADLSNPEIKMSKSSESKKGVILLLDTPEDIRKKIMRSTTDSENVVRFDEENKKGISNLMNIYSAFTSKSLDEIEKEFEGKSYKDFKEAVSDVTVEAISKIQDKYYEIMESGVIDSILDNGKEITTKIAKEKYEEVKRAMGVGRDN